MSMRATMNAVDDISYVRFAPSGLGALNSDGKPRLDQVNSGSTHWTKDRVVLAQETREALIATKRGIKLLRSPIYRIAGMQHR
ncbi:MAG: hypothetical protein H7Y39_15525 [Nitrospiraceae bacterium]|nr:hypothetical protein [Nitrospiraceae bacterium]